MRENVRVNQLRETAKTRFPVSVACASRSEAEDAYSIQLMSVRIAEVLLRLGSIMTDTKRSSELTPWKV